MQEQLNITTDIFRTRTVPAPAKLESQNRISTLCDQLLIATPSPCARELIFQIRSEAGGRTITGSLQGRDRK